MALCFEVNNIYNPHSKNEIGTLNIPVLDDRIEAQLD